MGGAVAFCALSAPPSFFVRLCARARSRVPGQRPSPAPASAVKPEPCAGVEG